MAYNEVLSIPTCCEHQSSSPELVNSSNSNDNLSESVLAEAEEKSAQRSSSSKNHSKGKYLRRRRRPLRRGESTIGFSSTEESETPVDTDQNGANGFSLKRRCSQLHEVALRVRQNQSNETTSSNEKLPPASSVSQSPRHPKAWFPVKESVRTSSYSPTKSDDQSSSSQADQSNLSKSISRNKTVSSKKMTAPPALKRLATSRPR